MLVLPDFVRPFSVVCNTSEFATECALLEDDTDGHESVVAYEFLHIKDSEKNYHLHDKEVLK